MRRYFCGQIYKIKLFYKYKIEVGWRTINIFKPWFFNVTIFCLHTLWCCQGERDDVVLLKRRGDVALLKRRGDVAFSRRKRWCGVVREKEMMWC